MPRDPYLTEIAVSVSALAGVGILFITAKTVLHKIHTFLSVVMVIGILAAAVCCIPHAVSQHTLGTFGSAPISTAYGIFSIVFLAPWAFVGFDVTAFDTAKFNFPIRKTRRILFAAIVAAALAYSALAIVGASAVPDGFGSWQAYISSIGNLTGAEAVPTFYAAKAIMGRPGLFFISMAALAGVLTGIIGFYRATIRVLTTMAEDRILSEAFSRTGYSTLFIMIFSVSLALFGRNTLSWFVDLASFGAIVGFGYTSAAAFKIARRETLKTVRMKQKKLHFEIDTSEVRERFVRCDVKNLNRVIMNLLNNAYKFTPEGGRVSVSVRQAEESEPDAGSYEIRIADNRIGMSKEFAEKMFHPFERERTSTVSGIEGTGLGLSITKSIMDLMGGTIDVQTEPDKGTEIILRLEFLLAEESEVRTDEPDPAAGSEQFDVTGKRLLLAEDNAINMEIAKMILTQAGFEVDSAENGQIAVDMLSAAEAGRYDAVLMDIQMPVMDGYTAARKIRSLPDRAKAEIPVIAMTANAFREDAEAAKAAGMQAHIAKPIDADLLVKTLREIISRA